MADLEAGPGLWIGGLHLHICGARRPGELMLMRLLARKGGAFNYHRLDPRIRLIVVSHFSMTCTDGRLIRYLSLSCSEECCSSLLQLECVDKSSCFHAKSEFTSVQTRMLLHSWLRHDCSPG